MSFFALLAHPLGRVVRARGAAFPVLAWALFAVFVAALARPHTTPVFDALTKGLGAVSLPLVAFALFGLVCPEGTIAAAARPLLFVGAPHARARVAVLVALVGTTALVAAVLGATVVLVAHGHADPPLGRDVAVSAGVSALGGAAYAVYYALGAALFGASGRGTFLVLDLVLGGLGAGAILTPRGHVRALFGGAHVVDLSARGSSIVLVLMLLVFGAAALARRSSRE
jgi:hypothetical protein